MKPLKQSFLKDYPVVIINNGIDLNVFKPTESEFRKKYNCEDKFLLLGVAFDWAERKGLDVFIDLAKKLDQVNPENIEEVFNEFEKVVCPFRYDRGNSLEENRFVCNSTFDWKCCSANVQHGR